MAETLPQQALTQGIKKLSLEVFHPVFWHLAESNLNAVETGHHIGWTAFANIKENPEGGIMEVQKVLLTSDEGLMNVRVDFLRDEWDGHLTYLHAERKYRRDPFNKVWTEPEHLVAEPRAFTRTDFNPISLLNALRTAKKLSTKEHN